MNTVELDARKAQLARDILNIDDIEILEAIQDAFKKVKAKLLTGKSVKPYTMEELDARIDKAEEEYEQGLYVSSQDVHREINELLASR